jgi:uncharacterized protein YegJ (DUF2314 family)
MPHVKSMSLLILVSLGACACDRTSSAPESSKAPVARPASVYQSIAGSEPIAVAGADDEGFLQAAAAEARKTMDEARARWTAANDTARRRWFVKWAAPISQAQAETHLTSSDDPSGVEHVWVMPVNWSPFRLEGVLISAPVHDLQCGKHQNDLVNFPVEECSDWLYRHDEPGSTFDGGYTIKALQARARQ